MTTEDFTRIMSAAVEGPDEPDAIVTKIDVPPDDLTSWAALVAERALQTANDRMSLNTEDASAIISATLIALTRTAFSVGVLFEQERTAEVAR